MKETYQLTKKQAINLHNSKFWESWDDRKIAEFQMMQDLLCVPFSRFHEAMEKTLGRSVWTHEFASSNRDKLMAELFDGKEPPSLKEIMDLIPEEKRIIILVEK